MTKSKNVIAVPVAQDKPCAGDVVAIETPTAVLQLSNSSIAFDCVDLLFSQISALHFQESPKIKVKSSKSRFAYKTVVGEFCEFSTGRCVLGA